MEDDFEIIVRRSCSVLKGSGNVDRLLECPPPYKTILLSLLLLNCITSCARAEHYVPIVVGKCLSCLPPRYVSGESIRNHRLSYHILFPPLVRQIEDLQCDLETCSPPTVLIGVAALGCLSLKFPESKENILRARISEPKM